MGTLVKDALGSGTGQVVDAAVGKHIADKTAAIKAGAWTGAAPDVRIAQVFFCFCNKSGKFRVCQCFARNIVILTGAFIGINVISEQIRLIAFHGKSCRITLFLFLRQALHGNRAKSFVPQGHIENCILIRDFHFIGVFLCGGFAGFRVSAGGRAGTGFCPVADFRYFTGGQAVLLFKDCFQLRLHLFRGKSVKFGGQVGNQLIGIVAHAVHIVAVFVIAGIRAFDVR